MKLTKAQAKEWETLCNAAVAAPEALEAKREELAALYRDVYDAKSERWQESDAGTSSDSWISTWEDASCDPSDVIAEVTDLMIESED